MLVSWNWLKEYLRLDMPVETLAERLMMSGLNLESISDVEGDLAIDLEVTSNRPDCLGHLGIAREAAVLFDRELRIPNPQPAVVPTKTSAVTSLRIACPELCPRYIARVIRGVKVGPSPFWLTKRLQTVGIASINNVVDITNYVLMECGQPLHAFDFDKLRGPLIEVRQAQAGEQLLAINQKSYPLSPEMCIIADAERPVAIAGVMGGLETEITASTRNVLIEVAEFAPRSIRATARKLNLHSPSSYRFERFVDPYQLDWASRRCAHLILELAGGELLDDPIVAGNGSPPARAPITLRFSQLQRVLGIEIPTEEVRRILVALGCQETGTVTLKSGQYTPPTWRRDLEREIDLVEDVARIHGYEQIPENRPLPTTVAIPPVQDLVRDRLASALVGQGFFEAVTLSFVSDELFALSRPFGDLPALSVDHSSRRKENLLRQSLVPSLLFSRRENERHGNVDARLFEFARVFLSAKPDRTQAEPEMLSLVTEQPYNEVKGLLEVLAQAINPAAVLTVKPASLELFQVGRGAEVFLDDKPWGWLGEVSDTVRQKLDLRDPVTSAELRLDVLYAAARLSATYVEVPRFPASERDLNLVLEEHITWQELAELVRASAGPHLESLTFGGQFRGQQIPARHKSYLLRLNYRHSERTLTNEEVETAQERVIKSCAEKLGAVLRA